MTRYRRAELLNGGILAGELWDLLLDLSDPRHWGCSAKRVEWMERRIDPCTGQPPTDADEEYVLRIPLTHGFLYAGVAVESTNEQTNGQFNRQLIVLRGRIPPWSSDF